VLTDVDVDANTRVDYLTYGQDVPDMEVGSLRGSITGLAMSSGALVAVGLTTYQDDPNLNADERVSVETNFRDSGMTAWVAIPLQDQGGVISVLHVLTNQKDSFDQDDQGIG